MAANSLLIARDKGTGGMGSFYRSRHELIFAFKKGSAPHINSFKLGQHGRYRIDVWWYKGMNSFGSGRMDEIQLHPAVKPVAMIADAIKDVSRRGGIVLDLFGGSGSTLIAVHKTGRRGYLCELDPVYCDRIIRRWQIYAKDDAVLLATENSFQERADSRHSSGEQPDLVRAEITTTPSVVPESPPDVAILQDVDDHLICWLPPFHPVLSRPDNATGHPPLQAAE